MEFEETTIEAEPQICVLCNGTGWKTASNGANGGASKERRVTRCDCQLRARAQSMLASARIPRRYEHCELATYSTDFPDAHPSLEFARLTVSRFVQEFDPRDSSGLLIVGTIGVGKTHLAVSLIKELVTKKGVSCLFYDYRELLKEIQNSYNETVRTTELEVLRPVFETDVLVLDELGAVKPTEWVWDTVSLLLNTRYNDKRTTIITTNLPDEAGLDAHTKVTRIGTSKVLTAEEQIKIDRESDRAQRSMRRETLGDRIGERMRSRLHEMCRTVALEGADYRQKPRSANFR